MIDFGSRLIAKIPFFFLPNDGSLCANVDGNSKRCSYADGHHSIGRHAQFFAHSLVSLRRLSNQPIQAESRSRRDEPLDIGSRCLILTMVECSRKEEFLPSTAGANRTAGHSRYFDSDCAESIWNAVVLLWRFTRLVVGADETNTQQIVETPRSTAGCQTD